MSVKILAFAGSLRRKSFNQSMVNIAAEGAKEAGAEVTVIRLADYEMPIYNGDLEEAEGLPENAKKLKEIFLEHNGILIASPEYNSSISAALKNTLDWISRSHQENEKPLACFQGKYATIMSASPGGLGGLRGLVHLRAILSNIQVTVLPGQFALGGCMQAFDENRRMVDSSKEERVKNLGKDLATVLAKIHAK